MIQTKEKAKKTNIGPDLDPFSPKSAHQIFS